MSQRLNLPCADLLARYQAGQTTTALAQHYRCSPTTIANQLRRCGATLRSSRFVPVAVSPELLRRLYEAEHLPLREIAARLGLSVSSVNNKRRLYGIPLRPRRRPTE